MSRSIRRLVSLFAAAALTFAQLAVSAYACPLVAPAPAPAALAEAMSPDCPEADNANLCAEHCAYGTVTSDGHGVALPVMDAAPLPWRSLAVPVDPQPSVLRNRHFVSPHPPPAIFFGVLRI